MSSAPSAIPRCRLRGVMQAVRVGRDGCQAVSSLDLEVHTAEVLALLGPNGAGQDDDGRDVRGLRAPRRRHHRGARPGPDRRQRAAARTHRRDAAGRRRLSRGPRRRDARTWWRPTPPTRWTRQWLLDTLGLTDAARTTYRRLSGGQQQRLALACALVGRPELVFLDEPTAGMDAHARLLVWELIDALRRDGVTVVLTTHQLKEAEELADRLVIIDHGGHGGRRHARRVDAQRRQGPVAVQRAAAPRPVAAGVGAAGGLQGHGGDAGRVPRRGPRRSAGARDGHGVVRADQRAGHRHAGRAAQPRGRVPRADRPGVAMQ